MPVAPMIMSEEERGPRGPYRKSEKTRARILAAALSVFSEAGFDKGSIREIAEIAEISQAGLLHHFPTKVALLSAILERRDDIALARSQAAPDGIGRLASMVGFAAQSAAKPAEVSLFAVLSAEATRPDHPANDYFKRRYSWTREHIVGSFRDVRERGFLRPGLRPEVAASMFMALWDGLQIQWLLEFDDVDVAAGLEQYLDSILTAPLRELTDHSTG